MIRNESKKDAMLEQASIHELQAAMEQGELTSTELVVRCLSRIAQFDQGAPYLNSVIEINPDAIAIAEALDAERKSKGARGALQGIPVLLKDNIETGDKIHTTAGALALQDHIAAKDAFLVRRLREAGAVILGKTNMTEWANGVSSSMWAGYSARGGQVLNPYGPGHFFVGGSSSGSAVAVAAQFAAAAVGTETSASILSPAIQNSIVGIKPTVGLVSRSGVIPYSYSQDTAGPMARTVADAALLLGALAGVDGMDAATMKGKDREPLDYTAFLKADGLQGARIGVFGHVPEATAASSEYDAALFANAVSAIRDAGADVIEDVEIPSFFRQWDWHKVNHEFQHGVDNYLRRLPASMPVHSLGELVEWNERHADRALRYGQDILQYRSKLRHSLNDPAYISGVLADLHNARQEGIDHALQAYNLDAILFPAYIGADISARAGYPTIAVPAGYMANGRPFGITFAGTAFSEPTLIRIAYAFEQHTRLRRPPIIGI